MQFFLISHGEISNQINYSTVFTLSFHLKIQYSDTTRGSWERGHTNVSSPPSEPGDRNTSLLILVLLRVSTESEICSTWIA